ncbi:hypothetical protein C8R47DRAFT_1077387 [Mycena vitilis]|nr:hypothetical protein C8R47DRAFT_1077387 [Mycena vitilis]
MHQKTSSAGGTLDPFDSGLGHSVFFFVFVYRFSPKRRTLSRFALIILSEQWSTATSLRHMQQGQTLHGPERRHLSKADDSRICASNLEDSKTQLRRAARASTTPGRSTSRRRSPVRRGVGSWSRGRI